MEKLLLAVDRCRDKILEAEKYLWKHPQTGYKEWVASEYMEKAFRALGYELHMAGDIPGFYTVLDTGREGPEVLVLGELDSVVCPSHPDADPGTGAVHSCGHHAQLATLLGIATALRSEGALEGLSGRIRLCAVPAEELLEIGYRQELIKKGVIHFVGGKPEFLSRGYFDGVDMAFMVHTSGAFNINLGSVGCLAKSITYKGKAAHAGGSPWDGQNALYAANCGLNAVNAIRETFKESDVIRFHPIITHGGDMVNAIPERVEIETYVRGKTFEGIVAANRRVDRALIGGAVSLGNNIDITDIPGYAPHINDEGMRQVAYDAAKLAIPHRECPLRDYYSTGSTDMGDLSCIMPVVHPYAGGAVGTGHGNDYSISDPEAACVDNAKWQLGMLYLLLKDEGARAKEILANFTPRFDSKESYLAYLDSLKKTGDLIEYGEDGSIRVMPV